MGVESLQPTERPMPKKRRTFTADFKATVALEALRGQRTITEIAQHCRVHPNQVSN